MSAASASWDCLLAVRAVLLLQPVLTRPRHCLLLLCHHAPPINNAPTQTAARPRDAEAWRLLGESSLLNADTSKSVAAYEKAIALSPDDQQIVTVRTALNSRCAALRAACAALRSGRGRLSLAMLHACITCCDGIAPLLNLLWPAAAACCCGLLLWPAALRAVLQGMVDAYVANSQQAKAISYLTDLRERLMTAATAAGSSASDEATASDAASVAAALPGEQDAGAAASSSAGEEASSSGRPRVDAIQVQLLLGERPAGPAARRLAQCCLLAARALRSLAAAW